MSTTWMLAVWFALNLLFLPSFACVAPSKVAALNDFFNATNGKYWLKSTNWGIGDPCTNNWFGLLCMQCSINQMSLESNNLTGTFPPSFSVFTFFTTLHLGDNNLMGTFPQYFTKFTNMLYMSLNDNHLSGTLPSGIGTMGFSLFNLDLSGNEFTGNLPQSMGNWSALTILRLKNNNFVGSLPNTIGDLFTLKQLDLSNNKFVGTLPSFIGQLANAQYLDLSGNSFTGGIPETFGSLQSITTLRLQNNQLNGTISPDFPKYATTLQSINLSSNSLTGVVPWPNNPNMQYFNASYNSFSCPLPAWCSPPPIGNGLCAPCVNKNLARLFCCTYSLDQSGEEKLYATCRKGTSCEIISGLQIIKQEETNNCGNCYQAEVHL